METISLSSKQQILSYILRTTLLCRRSLLSQIKEYPGSEIFQLSKTPLLEKKKASVNSSPKLKKQGTPPPTDLHQLDTPVLDITEQDRTNLENQVNLDFIFVAESNIFDDRVEDFEVLLGKSEKDSEEKIERDTILQKARIPTSIGFTMEKISDLNKTQDAVETPWPDFDALAENIVENIIENIPEIFREENVLEKQNMEDEGRIVFENPESEVAKKMEDATPVTTPATTGCVKITSDVYTASIIKYLIRIDKEEFAFADDEKSALAIINSLANDEVKKLTNDSVRVFRRDLQDGKEVQVCTQAIGILMNGRVIKHTIIDVIPVPKVFITLAK